MRKFGFVGSLLAAAVLAIATTGPALGGFDQAGYNDTARLFNGTGWSWCMDKVGDAAWCNAYLGMYKNDKLIMKWNGEWDRGNAENWANGPYSAWLTNEWNGRFKSGSGSVWHYKYIWVGLDGTASPYWRDGGYLIWGEFEVIMDQGQDPAYGPGHWWFAHAKPNGFGPQS